MRKTMRLPGATRGNTASCAVRLRPDIATRIASRPEPGEPMTTVPTPVTTHPTGGRTIEIAKGSHLALKGQQAGSPHEIFTLALMASICRGGKPVRCSNFLRGVSLRLESVMPPVPGEKAEALFDFIYAGVEQPLKAWLR